MSVTRVYRKRECDARGVPLDWERCRTCDGACQVDVGAVQLTDSGPVVVPRMAVCTTCGGHGSLKAAALAALKAHVWKRGGQHLADPVTRCEGCWHPMSDGTWEGCPRWDRDTAERYGDGVLTMVRNGSSFSTFTSPIHWSPCDKGCRHGGPGRRMPDDKLGWVVGGAGLTPAVLHEVVVAGVPYEASWRGVDIRVLDWAHDLRLQGLAILCLRCLAERPI